MNNAIIKTHQKRLKVIIGDLQLFMDELSKSKIIRNRLSTISEPSRGKAMELANVKSLKTKMKLWIYIHNLNKEKSNEYLKKYRERKVEELELQLEELNDDKSNALLHSYAEGAKRGDKKVYTASNDSGSSEYIRQTSRIAMEQYDMLKKYMDDMTEVGMW